jgi:uncharacterized protein
MKLELRLILHAILQEYVLPINGDHGVTHWTRVLENGLKLSQETDATGTSMT